MYDPGEIMDWIDSNLSRDPTDCQGRCREFSEALCCQFPELIMIRGHVKWAFNEEDRIRYPEGYPHWWCEDENGVVYDPTCPQFVLVTGLEYIPWDNSLDEPTGKCPNCGKYCYNGSYLCCSACEVEYMAYINGELYD